MNTAAKHRDAPVGGAKLNDLFGQLGTALDDLAKKQSAFSADHCDLASLDDLERALTVARAEHSYLVGGLADRRKAGRLSALLTEIIPAAITDRIEADVKQEALSKEPARSQAATAILKAITGLRTALERIGDVNDSFLTNLSGAERDMAMNDQSGGRQRDAVTVRLAAPTSHFSKLQAQLISTLDKFSLPHDQGILDVDRNVPETASRLFDVFDRRFEVFSDPIVGFRARLRKQPLGVVARRTGELTGRLALDARAIENEVDRIVFAVDEVMDAAIKHRPLWEPRIRRSREGLIDHLDDVRSLAQGSSGMPVPQTSARIASIPRRLTRFRTATGLSDASARATSRKASRQFGWAAELPAPDREFIVGSFEEASSACASLVEKLRKAIATRSRGENAFRLRRALEAALHNVEAVRLGIETEPSAFRWQAVEVSIPDSSMSDAQNLLDGLEETLNWLEPIARKFGSSESAYDNMLPEDLAEVGSELRDIGTALAACVEALNERQADASDDFIDLVDGLRQLTQSAADQADDTGDGSSVPAN